MMTLRINGHRIPATAYEKGFFPQGESNNGGYGRYISCSQYYTGHISFLFFSFHLRRLFRPITFGIIIDAVFTGQKDMFGMILNRKVHPNERDSTAETLRHPSLLTKSRLRMRKKRRRPRRGPDRMKEQIHRTTLSE